jgi:hypothetical protein
MTEEGASSRFRPMREINPDRTRDPGVVCVNRKRRAISSAVSF